MTPWCPQARLRDPRSDLRVPKVNLPILPFVKEMPCFGTLEELWSPSWSWCAGAPLLYYTKGATDFIVRLLLAVWIKYSLLVELLAALSVYFQDWERRNHHCFGPVIVSWTCYSSLFSGLTCKIQAAVSCVELFAAVCPCLHPSLTLPLGVNFWGSATLVWKVCPKAIQTFAADNLEQLNHYSEQSGPP